jgi:hypothetical protein
MEQKMRRYRVDLLIGVFIVLAFLASSCGSTPPTLAPVSATAVPPTATPLQPTATPVPTVSSSGGTSSSGGSFGTALDKVKGATAYRVDMQVTVSGSFGLSGAETPAPNATPSAPSNQEMTMVTMQGEVNGQNSHFSLQGLFAAFLGADPSKPIEVITLGDKSYIHGPATLIGATEDKWYELPADESSVAKPPLTPGSLLDSFTASGLDPNDFKKTSTESLDNRSCDVYSGDEAAVEKTFKTLGQAAGGADLSSLDAADFRFWVCDDGFLHQVRLAVQGHAQDKPDQKGSFLMQMHIHDIGTDIKIEAPANAEPLKMPSLINLETPTP